MNNSSHFCKRYLVLLYSLVAGKQLFIRIFSPTTFTLQLLLLLSNSFHFSKPLISPLPIQSRIAYFCMMFDPELRRVYLRKTSDFFYKGFICFTVVEKNSFLLHALNSRMFITLKHLSSLYLLSYIPMGFPWVNKGGMQTAMSFYIFL